MAKAARLRAIAYASALLFSSSIWLYAHSGLALTLDPVTGEKGCVSMLAQYVGLNESDWRFTAVQWYSLLWLPIALVAIILLLFMAVQWRRK
ncbi:MAG: hypothetical protein U5L74_09555 [Ideonella sp.]|nr:hypothetical protein [Ideonella sp.]